MIRVVPTGDLGLDVLVGGGWRLVKRPERESATVVVRGGSGAGKTLLGFQVALELARALGGDVAVGCMEILPSEYIAQLGSARAGLAAERVVDLSSPTVVASADEPRVFVGLLADLDPVEPDLVASLEALVRDVTSAGGKPVALIVDSLIEGYGVGSSAPRIHVDAVMKFAAQGGYGLVLCEEAVNDAPSPWVFAADTVLQLGVESRERGRWIEVRKHRFAPCASGRHELDIVGVEHPEVFPLSAAWTTPDVRTVLAGHGWQFGPSQGVPMLGWSEHLQPRAGLPLLQGSLVFVSFSQPALARAVATTVQPVNSKRRRALVIELDPLINRIDGWDNDLIDVRYVPSSQGPSKCLALLVRHLVEIFRKGEKHTIGRVLVGDIAIILSDRDASAWVEALRTLAALVLDAGWTIPVIVYDGQKDHGGEARARFAAQADVTMLHAPGGDVPISISQRWPREETAIVAQPAPLRAAAATLLEVTRVRGSDSPPSALL